MSAETEDKDRVRARVSGSAWWMLFVLVVFYVLSYADRVIITMLVVPIKADLGLSDVQMSIIIGAAFALSYAMAGFPLGWASDRFPRRWVIFFGITLWSAAAMAGGFARSFVMLVACRIGIGVGEAGLAPAAFSLLADAFPARHLTLAMSIYQTGAKIGSAAAYSIGALAIAYATALGVTTFPFIGTLQPWQMVLILTGAPGCILAFLIFTVSEPSRKPSAASMTVESEGFLQFLKRERALISLLLSGFSIVTITAYSLISWVPTYLTREFGWHPDRYGFALTVIGLSAAAGMIIKGWIVDWLYARGMRDAHLRFYTWILMIALPLSMIAFVLSDPIEFIIAYGILEVIAIQYVVFMVATLHLVVPKDMRGRMTGIFLAALNGIGLTVGPLLTAFFTDVVFHDEQKLGASLAVTCVSTILVSLILLRLALRRVSGAIERAEAR